MDPALRDKSMAKAKRQRLKQERKAHNQRQRERRSAGQSLRAASANYFRALELFGSESPEADKAQAKLDRAEARWGGGCLA